VALISAQPPGQRYAIEQSRAGSRGFVVALRCALFSAGIFFR